MKKLLYLFTFLLSTLGFTQEVIPFDLATRPPLFKECVQYNTIDRSLEENKDRDKTYIKNDSISIEAYKKCFKVSVTSHMVKYLNEKLDTPLDSLDIKPGNHTIYASFICSKNGKPENVRVRAPHIELTETIKRGIEKLPFAAPAEKDDKKVSVIYTFPYHIHRRDSIELSHKRFFQKCYDYALVIDQKECISNKASDFIFEHYDFENTKDFNNLSYGRNLLQLNGNYENRWKVSHLKSPNKSFTREVQKTLAKTPKVDIREISSSSEKEIPFDIQLGAFRPFTYQKELPEIATLNNTTELPFLVEQLKSETDSIYNGIAEFNNQICDYITLKYEKNLETELDNKFDSNIYFTISPEGSIANIEIFGDQEKVNNQIVSILSSTPPLKPATDANFMPVASKHRIKLTLEFNAEAKKPTIIPSDHKSTFVETQAPVYKGCKGTNSEIEKCFHEKINYLVSTSFNREVITSNPNIPYEAPEVNVKYDVTPKGTLSNIVVSNPYPEIIAEVEQNLKKVGHIIAASKDGIPQTVHYSTDILFNHKQRTKAKSKKKRGAFYDPNDKANNVTDEMIQLETNFLF